MDRQKFIIIGMSITVFLLFQYIILEKWQTSTNQEMFESFQKGHDQGLKDAIMTLYTQTEDCHISTAATGNFTKQYVDFNCLEFYSEKSKP